MKKFTGNYRIHKTLHTGITTLVFATGCATMAAPTRHLADAQGDLRAAQTVATNQVPRAALHLQLAKEELAVAKKLMDDSQHEQAEFMLNRVQADSELAVRLAKNGPLEEKAAATQEALESLNKATAP